MLSPILKSYIVIPTSGRESLLHKTLESLSFSDFGSFSPTVIIVENGTCGGAKETIKKFSSLDIVYKYVEEPSKSKAINFALKEITNGFLIFFDNDIIVQPNTVCNYIQAAMSYGEGHYFGGPTSCIYEEPLPEEYAPFACISIKGIEAGLDRGDHLLFLGHNWACFACDFWKVGGYDPRLGPGKHSWVPVGDEDEIICRLSKICLCKPIFLPDCRAFHHVDKKKVKPRWIKAQTRRHGMSNLYRSRIITSEARQLPDFPLFLIKYALLEFLSSLRKYIHAVMAGSPGKLDRCFACHYTFGKFHASILFKWLKYKAKFSPGG